jgi:hypothetical protein
MTSGTARRTSGLLSRVRTRWDDVTATYGSQVDPDGPAVPPLGGHLVAMAVFGTAVTTAGLLGRDRLPERYEAWDIVLGGVAVHKLSRIIAKESVASPLRAPFTHFVGPAGSAELEETPREGPLKTVGELLTCPFCLAPWLSAVYVAGLAAAPRLARAGAAVFASVALSDTLQHASARVRAD